MALNEMNSSIITSNSVFGSGSAESIFLTDRQNMAREWQTNPVNYTESTGLARKQAYAQWIYNNANKIYREADDPREQASARLFADSVVDAGITGVPK